ncbi:hypothetical protein ACRALDRAFT_207273 [Sodiomyces alcalophilus JCM 7366]|uniref:uncharacterized protein n=1 Tax=Sodiomyces alcalophilus JCM 7366 TaxID=591952 RepID=UPI0039B5C460
MDVIGLGKTTQTGSWSPKRACTPGLVTVGRAISSGPLFRPVEVVEPSLLLEATWLSQLGLLSLFLSFDSWECPVRQLTSSAPDARYSQATWQWPPAFASSRAVARTLGRLAGQGWLKRWDRRAFRVQPWGIETRDAGSGPGLQRFVLRGHPRPLWNSIGRRTRNSSSSPLSALVPWVFDRVPKYTTLDSLMVEIGRREAGTRIHDAFHTAGAPAIALRDPLWLVSFLESRCGVTVARITSRFIVDFHKLQI